MGWLNIGLFQGWGDKELPRVGHLTGLLQSPHFLCSYVTECSENPLRGDGDTFVCSRLGRQKCQDSHWMDGCKEGRKERIDRTEGRMDGRREGWKEESK